MTEERFRQIVIQQICGRTKASRERAEELFEKARLDETVAKAITDKAVFIDFVEGLKKERSPE